MKETIRKYTVNGFDVRVVKYTENNNVTYHVEHDLEAVQDCGWYEGEWNKGNAIAEAQFLAGWIERNTKALEAVRG